MKLEIEIEITDELLDAIADRVVAKLPAAGAEIPAEEDYLGLGAAAEKKEEAKVPTVEEAQDAAVAYINAGKDKAQKDKRKAQIKALSPKHGGDKVSEIPEGNRAAFIQAVKALK